MPLTEQEEKCVDAVCRYLDETVGGTWAKEPGQTLDELNLNRPSPEVCITNGDIRAAVEVKRLSNDIAQPYKESILSLEVYLAPSCGGYYTLFPCSNLRFPIDHKLRRHLHREIAKIAPMMRDEETRPIAIPRAANLIIDTRIGPSLIRCCHANFEELHLLRARINGKYGLLTDNGEMEHSFVTDDGRESFLKTMIAALESGNSQQIEWLEEWPLTRIHGNTAGVYVFGTSEVFEVKEAISISVERMIEKALPKFRSERWAELHIIALDSKIPFVTPDLVREAMLAFDAHELRNLELVLLVDNEDTYPVWPQ